MEKYHPELRPLPTRQSSRSLRSDLRGTISLLLEHRQSNMKHVTSRTEASGHNDEFYYSLYSSNISAVCSDINEKPSKFNDTTRKNYEYPTVYGSLEVFSKDFASLLDNPEYSDVEIKCGDEVMKAHKNILTSRSPVFKAMFGISMVESTTGVVTIADLDSQVVRDLLSFIYTNKVQNLSLIKACGLLEASTKYQIQTLKDICVDFLIAILSREHALLILQKADLYDEKLKKCTIKFISENFFDLRMTEEWIAMQTHNPILALEVCNMVIDKLAEKH